MFFNGNSDFENLLDVDWDKRKKVLEKDFNRKFKGNYL